MLGSCKTKKDSGDSDSKPSIAREYHENGAVKTETESVGGKANGLMKTFDISGNLKSVYTFKDGIRQGPAVSYFPTGELEMKMYYNIGHREGTTLWYYKSGKLFREVPYKTGKIEGIRKSYYEDGTLMSEAPYLGGYPGLGLKEYNKKGKLLTDETKIIIKQINQIERERRVIFELRLSENHPQIAFFQGDLTDGKFLNDQLWPLPYENGVAKYIVSIPSTGVLKDTYTFSVSYQSGLNDIMVLSKKHYLSIVQ
jgi:hypothetical protein